MRHNLRDTLYKITEKACDEAIKIEKEGQKLSRFKLFKLNLLVKLVLFTI